MKQFVDPDLDPAHHPALARRCIVMSLVQRVRGESKRRKKEEEGRIRIRKRMKSTRERRELRPNHTRRGLFLKPGEVLVFPGFSRPGPIYETVSYLLMALTILCQ